MHACYTNIPALFSERGLDTNTFPYLSATNSFEYPPVIGLGNWLISFITPIYNSHRFFFDINAVIIITLFFVSALVVRNIAPKYQYKVSGLKEVIVDVKFVVPVPSFVLVESATVGAVEVFHTTPFEVIFVPVSVSPPDDAVLS